MHNSQLSSTFEFSVDEFFNAQMTEMSKSKLKVVLYESAKRKSGVQILFNDDGLISIGALAKAPTSYNITIEGKSTLSNDGGLHFALSNNFFMPFFTVWKRVVFPYKSIYSYAGRDKFFAAFLARNLFSSLLLKRKVNFIFNDDSNSRRGYFDLMRKHYFWHIERFLKSSNEKIEYRMFFANFFINVIKFDNPLIESHAENVRRSDFGASYSLANDYVDRLTALRNEVIANCYS